MPSPQDWFVSKLEELRSTVGNPTQAQLLVHDRKSRKALTRSSLSDLLAGRFKKAPPWERVAAYGSACVSAAQAEGILLPLEPTIKQLRGDHDTLTRLLEPSTPKLAARAQRSVALDPPAKQPRPSRRMFGAMPVRAGAFQHRAVATQLSRAGAGGGTAVVSGAVATPTTVLTGLGGVGKTQLAADHAHTLWDTGQVDLLMWISARNRDAIMAAYIEAAVDLLDQDPAMPERAWRRLLQWLAETSHRWLIVFDDLQRPEDLTGLWPPHSAVGQVVVTTRRRDAALHGHGRKIVDVELYTPAESLSYLIEKLPNRARTDNEQTALASLAADLGYLPLALAQAAAYLINRPLFGTADYCARITEYRTVLRDVLPSEQSRRSRTCSPSSYESSAQITPAPSAPATISRACVAMLAIPLAPPQPLEDLLADCLRVFGPDASTTLTVRGNLASLQGEAGDPAGAADAFQDLLADYLRIFGPDHPGTLGTRNNLANMRGDAGDPAGAAAALEDLLADCLRVFSPDAPTTSTIRGNLASWRARATR